MDKMDTDWEYVWIGFKGVLRRREISVIFVEGCILLASRRKLGMRAVLIVQSSGRVVVKAADSHGTPLLAHDVRQDQSRVSVATVGVHETVDNLTVAEGGRHLCNALGE